MSLYKHRFDSVESYLHHRRPYLLVDSVVEILPTEIWTMMTVPREAGFIEGHFPNAPVLPGAMMQELTTQSAGILIAAEFNPMEHYDTTNPDFNEFALGVLVKVRGARFRGFARPDDVLQAHVRLVDQMNSVFDFEATVECDGRVIMRNSFQLANIKADLLTSDGG